MLTGGGKMRWDKKDIPHKGWTEIGMEDLGEEAEFGEDIEDAHFVAINNVRGKYKRYDYQIPYVDLEFNQAAFGGICLSPTLGQEKAKKKLESALKKYSITNCITTSDIPVRY